METGFEGTFVISWSQTELDGLWAAPISSLRTGAVWRWTGEAVRVDGPREVLKLSSAIGEADLRRRAARTLKRLIGAVDGCDVDALIEQAEADPDPAPLFDASFTVTDGRGTWTVTLIERPTGGRPLLMFHDAIPPREAELWVVNQAIDMTARQNEVANAGGVICFTPGTMIQCEDGPRLVDEIDEGVKIQTKDNGCQEVLWMGRRRITGARLHAMPRFAPVRLVQGALGDDIPDQGLLVSPDHRIIVRGPKARSLFNADEVLVAASDLVNEETVFIDHSVREVTYIHMLLEEHQVVFANGVETESFHPASGSLSTITPQERERLVAQMPQVVEDATSYGTYARRSLSASEAAILRHDVA